MQLNNRVQKISKDTYTDEPKVVGIRLSCINIHNRYKSTDLQRTNALSLFTLWKRKMKITVDLTIFLSNWICYIVNYMNLANLMGHPLQYESYNTSHSYHHLTNKKPVISLVCWEGMNPHFFISLIQEFNSLVCDIREDFRTNEFGFYSNSFC